MKQKLTTGKQMEFDFIFPSDLLPCDHSFTFVTHACVPTGVYCPKCHKLICQFIPKSPDQLGYVSADWLYFQDKNKRFAE